VAESERGRRISLGSFICVSVTPLPCTTGAVLNVKTSYLKATGTNSYGVFASGAGGLSFNQSEVTGTTYSIEGSGTPVFVGASRIAGNVAGSTVACSGAYNANYVALNTTCH
jgi:hypothetical protein